MPKRIFALGRNERTGLRIPKTGRIKLEVQRVELEVEVNGGWQPFFQSCNPKVQLIMPQRNVPRFAGYE
jgi:hypothetical protein